MRALLFFLIISVSYAAHSANLLVNSGFESGLTNWTADPSVSIRTSDPLAYEGTNYIFGDSTPSFTLSQTVDLLGNGLIAADIDAGIVELEYGGWQAGYYGQTDYGTISLNFLDGSSSFLGSVSLASFFSSGIWEEQSGVATVVAQTRFIEYSFTGIRQQGSNNDAYLDAAYLEASTVPLPASVWLFGSALGLLGWGMRKAA